MPPRGVKSSSKRSRQYEHIKESARESGRSPARAKQIAAATVNKQRREAGETKGSTSGGRAATKKRSTSGSSRAGATKKRGTGGSSRAGATKKRGTGSARTRTRAAAASRGGAAKKR